MQLQKEHRNISGIYIIRNMNNGWVYIGKSVNVYNRIQQHVLGLRKKDINENRKLQSDWDLYLGEGFQYRVLERTEKDDTILSERELYWITKALGRGNCYNLRIDSDTKCIVSDETRQKCSESQKKRYENPEEREKMSIAGKKAWENTSEEKRSDMKMKVADSESKRNILQYDKNTNKLIKRWKHFHEISLEHPDYARSPLLSTCNGWKKSYKGFIWRYEMKETGEVIIPEKKY